MQNYHKNEYGAAVDKSVYFSKNRVAILPKPVPKPTVVRPAENSVIPLVSTGKALKENKAEENKKSFTPFKPGYDVRCLTGTIDKVIKWHKILQEYAHYEVIGPVANIGKGTVKLQQVLLLRNKGPVLQVVFYSNDWIKLPNFELGQLIRCVGRMIGDNTLHAFKIREATPAEIEHCIRISYVCDQYVTNIARAKPK